MSAGIAVVSTIGVLSVLGLSLGRGGQDPSHTPGEGIRDCQVILMGRGSYRLEVTTGGGPVPVVDFIGATGPLFDEIRITSGSIRDCDQEMGAIEVQRSPNSSPLLFHVANDLRAAAAVRWHSSKRSHIDYPYRDFGNLSGDIAITSGIQGFREILASVMADLISRHANPTGFLTDKGARWVAQQAVSLMMQGYVEGRDPGLMVDGLLTSMVGHLQGHAEEFLKSVGGSELQLLLKPHLTSIALAVTSELVEAQPPVQTVTAQAYNPETDCSHFLSLTWEFKGGSYRSVLTVRCGTPPPDRVSSVVVTTSPVRPGEAGTVTVQALSQLGVAFPLSAATVTGLTAVMTEGSTEPAAVINGRQATFSFTAAKPRADGVYQVRLQIVTDNSTGLLTGSNAGMVTVINTAPRVEAITPEGITTSPGEELALGGLRLLVIDDNADKSNPGEVDLRSITIAHPAGLETTPQFDRLDDLRRVSFDPGSGAYVFELQRTTTVKLPHAHGIWTAPVTVSDNDRQSADGAVALEVDDVAPEVISVIVDPDFVHRGGGNVIDVRVRVGDANGAADVERLTVDARAAGGRVFALTDGLTETGRGEDWLAYRLTTPFPQTDAVGEHPIRVEVADELSNTVGSGTLHVGNLAPELLGYGYIHDDGVLLESGASVPQNLRGLCPRQNFKAGLIVRDPEADSLQVTGVIVETGETMQLSRTDGNVFIGEMKAPQWPRYYTLRLEATEVPPDQVVSATLPLEVVNCTRPDDSSSVGLEEDLQTSGVLNGLPRDPTSQLMLASTPGVIADPIIPEIGNESAEPGTPGPSSLLLDSLQLLLAELSRDGEVETWLLATGGSTGPVIQMFALNGSGTPVAIRPAHMVLEPVRISPSVQGQITTLLERYLAAGGSATVVSAYCLEFLRKAPVAGTVMRIASAPLHQQFASQSSLLDAADRLQRLGRLHPDSDPGEYLDAVKQWAIWSGLEEFDLARYERELLELTRRNQLESGGEWNDELEGAVRRLVPNRWADIQQTIREADSIRQ